MVGPTTPGPGDEKVLVENDDATVLDADFLAPPRHIEVSDDATVLDADFVAPPKHIENDESVRGQPAAASAQSDDDDVTIEPDPVEGSVEGEYWQPTFNRRIARAEASLGSDRRVVPLADDSELDSPTIASVAELGDGWALSHVNVHDVEPPTEDAPSFDAMQLATLALILIAVVLVVLVIVRLV